MHWLQSIRTWSWLSTESDLSNWDKDFSDLVELYHQQECRCSFHTVPRSCTCLEQEHISRHWNSSWQKRISCRVFALPLFSLTAFSSAHANIHRLPTEVYCIYQYTSALKIQCILNRNKRTLITDSYHSTPIVISKTFLLLLWFGVCVSGP